MSIESNSRDSQPALPTLVLRLADLSKRTPTDVLLTPDAAQRGAVADVLGIPAIRKLRFEGTLSPEGKTDWRLDARLGATVVQECVATLDPVTTRIDEPIVRRYLADLPTPEAGEVEMPEDDTLEGLPATLDIAAVMIEALALALPPYPRSDAAEVAEFTVTEPGKTPMTQADLRPFAGLAALRGSLGKAEDTEK